MAIAIINCNIKFSNFQNDILNVCFGNFRFIGFQSLKFKNLVVIEIAFEFDIEIVIAIGGCFLLQ